MARSLFASKHSWRGSTLMRAAARLRARASLFAHGLLHPRLQAQGRATRHALRFILSNIISGALCLVLLTAAGLAWGRADLVALAVLWASISFGAILWAKRSGSIAGAEALCAVGLALFATALCALTGGLASPFLPWLMVAPLEALVSGRRMVIWSCLMAGTAGVSLLAVLTSMGATLALPDTLAQLPGLDVIALLAALAAATGAALSVHHRQAENEAQLAHRERDIRMLTNGAPDMIARLDADGRFLYVSPASERMLGLSPQELRGLTPGLLVHIADLAQVEAVLKDLEHKGGHALVRARLRQRDGGFVWVEMTLSREDSGTLIAVIRDIAGQKAAENELIAARERAEELSRSKSRFLANMSHELRTPLNAIIGFSDMIRAEVYGPAGNERYREYAGHIHASGQHLVDMISDLLDMSKIEAGKFRLSLKPVDLQALVVETIEMVRLSADDAGVSVTASDLSQLPLPMADRRAIKQILLNLLSNAVKFTPAQGRVTISARIEAANIVLTVTDTGVGIPEGDLHRIGKPFEQAHDDFMRTPQKGTGLGLSLVAALAELHGGSMKLDSAPGDGTTVSVTLPIEPILQPSDDTIVYPERFRAVAKG